VPDGSIIDFGAATYNISSNITLTNHNNLIFEGNSTATINSTATGDYTGSIFYQPNVANKATHITIRNFTVTAANLTPGHMSSSGEFAALLHTRGGSYFELDNIHASGLHGDVYTMNSGAHHAWVHDCVVTNCGRNFISVVYGSNLLVERNTFGLAGWSIFDIEPEVASNGATMTDIVFQDNTAQNWSSPTGFFFAACSALTSTANVNSVTVTRNSISGNSLFTMVGKNTLGRRANYVFTNNTGIATPIYQKQPGMISFWRSDGVTVTGNVQPLLSGETKPLVYFDASCTEPLIKQSS
jgi:hypothetical protein